MDRNKPATTTSAMPSAIFIWTMIHRRFIRDGVTPSLQTYLQLVTAEIEAAIQEGRTYEQILLVATEMRDAARKDVPKELITNITTPESLPDSNHPGFMTFKFYYIMCDKLCNIVEARTKEKNEAENEAKNLGEIKKDSEAKQEEKQEARKNVFADNNMKMHFKLHWGEIIAKNVIERCFNSGISEAKMLKSFQEQEQIARTALTSDLQEVHTPYEVKNSNNYMKMTFSRAVCVVLKEGEYLDVLKKGREVEEEDGFVLVENEDEEWQFVRE
ncbi:hypothetical protein QBC43DRAFT_291644 [Cladorrhinum sp. PSN259]|nr:hypothetical protein QBC43DRAFT_291644 [Cladorrhinum sp. PSN259]